MKINLLMILLAVFSITASGQNKKTKKMLAEIEGQWNFR